MVDDRVIEIQPNSIEEMPADISEMNGEVINDILITSEEYNEYVDEVKDLMSKIEATRDKYYSLNVAIDQVVKRTFSQLLVRFVEKTINHLVEHLNSDNSVEKM